MELLHKIAPGTLDAINIFFPDPWPKARHHKRRLIRPGNVALLRERLRPGGILHCATDWPHYASAMAETLDADPGMQRVSSDRAGRPETKFERRGTAAGRPITDLRYARAGVDDSPPAPNTN
jgi:tRNA (guanine-N7-)-methyltransferase